MAVAGRDKALSTFRELINGEVDAGTILRDPYLPKDLEPRSDDPVRMDPSTRIGGYGNDARYTLDANPETRRAIADRPSKVLSGRPSIMDDSVAAEYVKASLDLTMEGGTTSGVVYPLAVCELATDFRFRNVGGASAGAIAAALTAAAELGRSSRVLASGGSDQQVTEQQDSAATTNGNHIRPGFTGMVDIMSWLTQASDGDQKADEYRLAQLFRPDNATAAIYRVAVAIMRGHTWPLPLLALFAFGWVPRLFTLALISGAVVLTGYVESLFTAASRTIPEIIGLGALGVSAYITTLVGLALVFQGIRSARRKPPTKNGAAPGGWLEKLRDYTSANSTSRPMITGQLVGGAALIILVVVIAIFWRAFSASAFLVGLAASLIVAIGLSSSIWRYVGRFRDRAFGLLPGTTAQRNRSLLDVMAGVPKPTVEKSLVPWLNDCLSALAGLPKGEVLRFGHLWEGVKYLEHRLSPTPEHIARWRLMSQRTDHRLVNLELMTTDVTRQRPFRFPLEVSEDNDPEQLWVCVDQLSDGESEIFPEPILRALRETDCRDVLDRYRRRLTLHKLPQPWDLPVIFAVRISMSLPLLFQAVPIYRIQKPTPIQDDFGRTLMHDGKPVTARTEELAQELWFSDGGITSNFPVHFFDNPLPRWPTVSLNLGIHPEEAPHQDIWLPQDWENLHIPVKTLGPSGLGFGAAIFKTALSWRDSLQTALPGYRNRTAQVRMSSDEGGTNLFMSRATIASLAVRGAFAGARLRTRFTNDGQWSRFRWLRLRVAMNNIENLRANTNERRGFYQDALSRESWLGEQEDLFPDTPVTGPIRWYQPLLGFWPKAARLLNTFADAYRPPDVQEENVMTSEMPEPYPVIRQVPRG